MILKMEGEMYRTLKVWLTVFVCLCYCFALRNITQKGGKRLFCVLPVVFIFLFLPLNLQSAHICGITSFFIAWLANFKILLFAFGKGPLSSERSIPITRFVAIACLPIKIQRNAPLKGERQTTNGRHRENLFRIGKNEERPISENPKRCHKLPLNYGIKCLLWGIMLRIFDYRYSLHPNALLVLYSFHIYLSLEIILAVSGAMAKAILGLELEPHFDKPYLSSSLQDFWGRRWNLMVTSILRPTVYQPVLGLSTPAVGRQWAHLLAIISTFLVSGLMHELIFYDLGRMRPTWEITRYFLLNGVCLMVEVTLKKKVLTRRMRLPRFVSAPLTLGFLIATASWLFFPQFLRCKADVRAFEEYAAVAAFLKTFARSFSFRFSKSFYQFL